MEISQGDQSATLSALNDIRQKLTHIEFLANEDVLDPETLELERKKILLSKEFASLASAEKQELLEIARRIALLIKEKTKELMIGSQPNSSSPIPAMNPSPEFETISNQIDSIVQDTQVAIARITTSLGQPIFDPNAPNYEGSSSAILLFGKVKKEIKAALSVLERSSDIRLVMKAAEIRDNLLVEVETTEQLLNQRILERWKSTIESSYPVFGTLKATTVQLRAEVALPTPNFSLLTTAETQLDRARQTAKSFSSEQKQHVDSFYLSPANNAIGELRARQTQINEAVRTQAELTTWLTNIQPVINALRAVLNLTAQLNGSGSVLPSVGVASYGSATDMKRDLQSSVHSGQNFINSGSPNSLIEAIRNKLPGWIQSANQALDSRIDIAGESEWKVLPEIVALDGIIAQVVAIDENANIFPSCGAVGPGCFDVLALTNGTPGFESLLRSAWSSADNAKLLEIDGGLYKNSQKTIKAIVRLRDRHSEAKSHLDLCIKKARSVKTLELDFSTHPWSDHELSRYGELLEVFSYSPSTALNRLITNDFPSTGNWNPAQIEAAYKARIEVFKSSGGSWAVMADAMERAVLCYNMGLFQKNVSLNVDWLVNKDALRGALKNNTSIVAFDNYKQSSMYRQAISKVVELMERKLLLDPTWSAANSWSNGKSFARACFTELLASDPAFRAYIDSFKETDPSTGTEIDRRFLGNDASGSRSWVQTTAQTDAVEMIVELAQFTASTLDLRRIANTHQRWFDTSSPPYPDGSDLAAMMVLPDQSYKVCKKGDLGEYASRDDFIDVGHLDAGEITPERAGQHAAISLELSEHYELLCNQKDINALRAAISWWPCSYTALFPFSEQYFLMYPEMHNAVGHPRLGDNNYDALAKSSDAIHQLVDLVGGALKEPLGDQLFKLTPDQIKSFIATKMDKITTLVGMATAYNDALPWSLDVKRVKRNSAGDKIIDTTTISPRTEVLEVLRAAVSCYVVYIITQIPIDFDAKTKNVRYHSTLQAVREALTSSISKYSTFSSRLKYDLPLIPNKYQPSLSRRIGYSPSGTFDVQSELLRLVNDPRLEKKQDSATRQLIKMNTRREKLRDHNKKRIPNYNWRTHGTDEWQESLQTSLEWPYTKPSNKDAKEA